jgi:putative ABC transport system permease protein
MDIWTKRSIIISKSTAAALKLKSPVIGTPIKYGALQGTVIGVIEDFQGLSLLKKPSMVIIRAKPVNDFGNAFIRISSTNMKSTIGQIEQVWKSFFPERTFSFSFVDDRLQQLYTSQERLSNMFNLFAILSIVIAFLGLFSIVSIMTNQRIKEISIRRIIGAGYGEIIRLISVDFLKLIIIAICIGVPIAWWSLNSWLESFPFRIAIELWWFPVICLSVIIVALMALSLIINKAARTNIASNLKVE